MKKLISSLHKVFEESPSRRAHCKNITESNDKEFSMLFVSIDGWKMSQLLKELGKYGERS